MAKIIQVTTFFYPLDGGVEQQVLDISKELKKAGHDVEVICTNATRTKEKVKEQTGQIDEIPITRCNVLFSLSQFYKFAPGIFRQLMKKDFDIVHVHGFRKFEVYFALLAAKVKRKKIVVTTHNPFATDPKSRGRLLQFFVKMHDLTFGKMFTRMIHKIIALTNDEIEPIEKFGYKKDNIHVIPNGISEELYKQGDGKLFLNELQIDRKKYKHIVLWVGRINRVKNLETLDIAIKQIPDALFVFIGPDDDASKPIKKKYQSSKNVLFTGAIQHESLLNAYAASDVFVLPSLHEAFGMVLVEAMAQGVPVISTNKGGPHDIIEPAFGKLLNPKDPWGWMLALKEMLNNDRKREKMGLTAKKAAQRYRWRNVMKELLAVYELPTSK